MRLIVYPAPDLESAKTFFRSVLGTDPYVDTPYYVGYHGDELEIGLDPHGPAGGPIVYWDTEDIQGRLAALVDSGGTVVKDVTDVSNGLLVATVKDAAGSIVGLRQAPEPRLC